MDRFGQSTALDAGEVSAHAVYICNGRAGCQQGAGELLFFFDLDAVRWQGEEGRGTT